MNVNETRNHQRPSRMEEAPGTRPSAARSPSEVLAILGSTHHEPKPLMIGGLWKTGLLEPQGAVS